MIEKNMETAPLPVTDPTKHHHKGIQASHVLYYLNKNLNDREISELLQCSSEAIKYWRNKLNYKKDEIQAFKKDRQVFQQFLQSRITSHQIDFVTKNDTKIEGWADYKAATISKACEIDKEVVVINQFGTVNVQINAVDDKIQALKAKLKARSIDLDTVIDTDIVDK